MKTPLPGKVKTRLAKDIGNNAALQIYIDLVGHILQSTHSPLYKQNIFLADYHRKEKVRTMFGSHFSIQKQSDGDIGERMYEAFNKTFQDGFSKCVLIGTDTPGINAKLINKAFSLLDKYDSVIGPSNDGGYYLIALKKVELKIFSEIKWSSSSVYRETISRLELLNKSFVSLEILVDIDTLEDLKLANFGNYSSL